MDYNLLTNGVYWGYNPHTNLLLTSWDILVGEYTSPIDKLIVRDRKQKQLQDMPLPVTCK